MIRNSTIRQKIGQCEMCGPGSKDKPLTKGLCQDHYWFTVRLKSVERLNEREVKNDESLSELIEQADAVVSKYVRLSNAVNGNCTCYTCEATGRWQDMDCGHFIPRANLFTRFDVARNLRVQCHYCNRVKRGQTIIFGRKLNEEREGLADLLIEESTIVYKPAREEIKSIIIEYSEKTAKLKKGTNA
jgi:hypothetical protein